MPPRTRAIESEERRAHDAAEASPAPVRPAAAHSGPMTPENAMALQGSAGNRAVAGAVHSPGGVTVVQRAPESGGAERPAGADPLGGRLGPQDIGDVGAFMVAVTDAYAPSPLDQVPGMVGSAGNSFLRSLETRLVGTWTLAHSDGDDAPGRVAAHWDRLRPDLEAVGAWAAGQDFDAGSIARYRQGVRAIEARFVRWYSREVIDAAAPTADVGDPEAVYHEQLASQAAAIAAALREAVAKSTAGDRAKLLGQGKSGAKAGGDLAVGTETSSLPKQPSIPDPKTGKPVPTTSKGAAAGKVGFDLLALGLDILAKGGTLQDQLDGLSKAGLLKQGATAIDLAAFLVDTTHSVGLLLAKLHVGLEEGELLRTMAGKLDSTAVKQFKDVSKVLGYVGSVFAIASSTLKLIDAIENGDTKAQVEAGGGLAASLAGLGATILGASAAASASIGAVITMWTAALVAMGELGATLRALELEAKANRVLDMVKAGAVAAATGRRMAAAWEEAQMRKADAADQPDSVDAKAVAVLEASAEREIRERLVPQMNAVLSRLGRFTDDPDVDPEVRKSVAEHLSSIEVNFHQVDYLHPVAFTDLCRIVFGDVNAVTAQIAAKGGRLPEPAGAGR